MKAPYIFTIVAAFFTMATYAQSGRLKLTPSDFEKWGTLSEEKISPDGKWVSCKMKYESAKDTLFVINAMTNKKENYPGAVSLTFSPDSKSCTIKYPAGKISLLEFKTNKSLSYFDVDRFDFISGGYLVLTENQLKEKNLQLFDSKNKLQWQINNVVDYNLANSQRLAIITKNGVSLVNLSAKMPPVEIIFDKQSKFSRPTWSLNENSFAVFSQCVTASDSIKVVHHNCLNGKTTFLKSRDVRFNGTPFNIEPYKMVVSENNKQVYLLLTDIKEKKDEGKVVEVWDSSTLLEYPEQELLKDPETHPYLTIWNVETGKLQKLDDGDFINTKVLPYGTYAVSASKSSIVSRTSEFAPTDYYSIDLRNGKNTLIARQCSTVVGAIKVSPSGRYIVYFKNGHYYIFDNETGKVLNITTALSVDFNDVEFDRAGINPGYRIPGWTSDSRYVILYDQFDIWLFSPDGKVSRKITNGRSIKTQFRLEIPRSDMQYEDVGQLSRETINIQEGIVITARGSDYSSGFYWFSETEGLNKFYHGKYRTKRFAKAKDTSKYIYSDETDSRPPRLMLMDKTGKEPRIIYQSNKHYTNYKWSRSELITYNNAHGDALQGVLMYPSNYQAGKKYPMVVYIYERLSQTVYDYINPVVSNPIGFSPPTYLHDGYFVLMPDIKYEIGSPGPSAVDCVTSAVKSVLRGNIIEENHIGLLGHSYGGFQSAFIITQTPIFAAAVASGAITDPVSSYLTKNFERYRSENWRFEDHQYRMESSPLNNWEGYIKNSTIAHATNITTPLLSWNGKNDSAVNFEQGLELHLALRSLHKPNLFLLYPDQGHILTDPRAQLDLTMRVKGWFDKYLKNKRN